MKLLSPSPEAVAVILGLSESEATALLNQRRFAELREREDRRRCIARGGLASLGRKRPRCG